MKPYQTFLSTYLQFKRGFTGWEEDLPWLLGGPAAQDSAASTLPAVGNAVSCHV